MKCGFSWKPMDIGHRRYLVAEDRLQQQFREYCKAHFPKDNFEPVN